MRRLQEARLSLAGEELHTAVTPIVTNILDQQARIIASTKDLVASVVFVDAAILDVASNFRRLPNTTTHVLDIIAKWIEATAFSSSLDETRRDPNYSALKQLGWAAVPGLLTRMSSGTARLQCAELLAEITGADPISDADLGNARRIGEAWINWGRLKGLI
jgi:hypothetical protein